MAEVVL
jgi:hypothetical protein